MFYGLEKIFSKAETAVEVAETIFSAVLNLVWTIKTTFFLVLNTVGVTQTRFSEAEDIFYASETGFSITEKTLGEVPAAFVHPSNRIFRRPIIILLDSRENGDYLTLPTKRSSNRQFS